MVRCVCVCLCLCVHPAPVLSLSICAGPATPSPPHAHTPQMATALYFIDKLALRAGHEKDEDEADTVGCCTLKARPWGRGRLRARGRAAAGGRRARHGPAWGGAVAGTAGCLPACGALAHVWLCSNQAFLDPAQVENVECIEPNHIRFDFLGKDSMRYENTVEVSGTAACAGGRAGWTVPRCVPPTAQAANGLALCQPGGAAGRGLGCGCLSACGRPQRTP